MEGVQGRTSVCQFTTLGIAAMPRPVEAYLPTWQGRCDPPLGKTAHCQSQTERSEAAKHQRGVKAHLRSDRGHSRAETRQPCGGVSHPMPHSRFSMASGSGAPALAMRLASGIQSGAV